MSTATTPTVMRQTNALSVLRAIRRRAPVSRAEVARETGLSKPTVNAIVGDLIAKGYARETEPGPSNRMRPGPQANVLSFNAKAGLVAGFDLGVSRVRAGLADLDGNVLHSSHHTFGDTPPSVDEFAAILIGLIEEMRSEAGLGAIDVWAVGLGLPGFLDRKDGTIKLAPGFERWGGLPFRDILSARFAERFGCSFVAGGRVQFAMLAEHRHGAAQGLDDAVYVHLGKGIGLGLLVRGEIFEGSEGFAGEVGSIPADDPEPPPPGVGAFEWTAGGRAFARLARRAAEHGESPVLLRLCGGDPAAIEAPMVFEAAAEGDDAARRIIADLSGRIARGLAGVCCILNPSKLIIGAGLSRAGDEFIAGLATRISALMPFPVAVERTRLVDRTTVLGAIEQALRVVEGERFFLFSEPDRELAS